MGRIAILSSAHGGSTIPLAKALIERGYAIDYYMIANAVGMETTIEATDFRYITQSLGLQSIPMTNCPHLIEYINSKNFRFFSITLQRPYRNVPCIHEIMRFIRSRLIKKICSVINEEDYDLINIVGRYNLDEIASYCKYLDSKIIVSLHEVCNHFNPDFNKPSYLLKYLFKNKIDLVVHSTKSYNDIVSYPLCVKEKVHVISFGLFETYNALAVSNSLDLPSKFFLFIGGLSKYKGVDLLIEAADSIRDTKDFYFVIAGSGSCDLIDQIQNKSRFILINRFLSNPEFAELLNKSSVVVCPYRTASQSGIPQSTFVFGKPMIVSNLESFHSVISNGVEGLYHKPCDVADLANTIESIITNPTLLNTLTSNASKFCESHPDYSWNNIVDDYLRV